MNSKKLENELEGLQFDMLNDFISKGTAPDDMPKEIQEYLLQLQFIQQRLHRVESPKNVINSLVAFFPDLNVVTAKRRFDDALRFFYLDEDDSKEAWRNLLFETAMKAIQLAVRTVDNAVDSLKIVDAIKKAYEIKGLHLPETPKIPKELLEEKVEIFTLVAKDVGLPEANKQLISQQIDQFPLKEAQKLRIKMDAGVAPNEIFSKKHEQTED